MSIKFSKWTGLGNDFVLLEPGESLDFGDGFLRYDADCTPHSHFKCKSCGKVFDVMLPPPDVSKLLPPGFTLMGTSLYMFGLCDRCTTGDDR